MSTAIRSAQPRPDLAPISSVPRPRGRDLSAGELESFVAELAGRPELWIDFVKHESTQRLYEELLSDDFTFTSPYDDEIDPDLFWQIHRSTLVNTRCIASGRPSAMSATSSTAGALAGSSHTMPAQVMRSSRTARTSDAASSGIVRTL